MIINVLLGAGELAAETAFPGAQRAREATAPTAQNWQASASTSQAEAGQ